jgi:hypothetical protein
MVTHRHIIDRIARARTHMIRLKYGKVSLCVIALSGADRAPAAPRAASHDSMSIRGDLWAR